MTFKWNLCSLERYFCKRIDLNSKSAFHLKVALLLYITIGAFFSLNQWVGHIQTPGFIRTNQHRTVVNRATFPGNQHRLFHEITKKIRRIYIKPRHHQNLDGLSSEFKLLNFEKLLEYSKFHKSERLFTKKAFSHNFLHLHISQNLITLFTYTFNIINEYVFNSFMIEILINNLWLDFFSSSVFSFRRKFCVYKNSLTLAVRCSGLKWTINEKTFLNRKSNGIVVKQDKKLRSFFRNFSIMFIQ